MIRVRRSPSSPALVLIALVLLAGCGGAKAGTPRVERELARRLGAMDLSVTSVACVPRRERVAGTPVYRCNVDFGDPHIEIYCAAIVAGKLRAAAWRQAVRGRQDREASARECATRLRRAG